MMDDMQATMRRGTSRNALHNLARAVGGAVVDRDHFVIVVIECEQAGQRLLDVAFFIARRHDNRNQRIAASSNRIAVPFGRGDVGDARHADRSVDDAREPGQRENRACNPVKVMHPA